MEKRKLLRQMAMVQASLRISFCALSCIMLLLAILLPNLINAILFIAPLIISVTYFVISSIVIKLRIYNRKRKYEFAYSTMEFAISIFFLLISIFNIFYAYIAY